MKCSLAVEKLVESARRQTGPDPATRAHLISCDSCLERWESERMLTGQLRRLAALSHGLRSSEAGRQDLMRQFATTGRRRPVRISSWTWGLAAAAALVLAAGLFWNMGRRPATELATAFDSTVAARPADSGDEAESGFMAVPFAPPLADGEMVRVVHRELQPVELASLGVDVDPAWLAAMQSGSGSGMQGGVPADVLVGEDGFPRAVRLSDEASF
jgi:hypothetical protein